MLLPNQVFAVLHPVFSTIYHWKYFSFQITFAHHDGVMGRDGSNFMNNSLHLDDVYSVISRDVGISDVNSLSPVSDDVNHDVVLIQDSPDKTDDKSGLVSHQSTMSVDHVITCSPFDGSSVTSDTETLDRGTPSPNRDSGIESDISPVSTHSSQQVEKVKC